MAAPADRVQISKQESTAAGGDDADADPYNYAPLDPNEDAPEVQGVFIQPPSPSTTKDGLVYVSRDSAGNMLLKDGNQSEVTLTTLAAAGSGISAAQHKILRQVIHFIDNGPAEGFASGAFRETTGTVLPSAVIWYDDSGKTKKIVEKTIGYSGAFPNSIVWKVYDTDGSTVLATITDTLTLSGAFETSRSRAIA